MSPEIFVLLPSRGRPGPLAESVASLRELADDPARIEVLVAVDPDDPDTAQAARDCEAEAWRAPERFGYARLHEYVNALAHQAGGDWLLMWNDDARMRTRGWDSRVLEAQPGVLWPKANGYTVENTFPVVHRTVVDRLGHVSLSPHYDSWLHAVAEQAGIHHRIAVEVFHDRADFTGGHGPPRGADLHRRRTAPHRGGMRDPHPRGDPPRSPHRRHHRGPATPPLGGHHPVPLLERRTPAEVTG